MRSINEISRGAMLKYAEMRPSASRGCIVRNKPYESGTYAHSPGKSQRGRAQRRTLQIQRLIIVIITNLRATFYMVGISRDSYITYIISLTPGRASETATAKRAKLSFEAPLIIVARRLLTKHMDCSDFDCTHDGACSSACNFCDI